MLYSTYQIDCEHENHEKVNDGVFLPVGQNASGEQDIGSHGEDHDPAEENDPHTTPESRRIFHRRNIGMASKRLGLGRVRPRLRVPDPQHGMEWNARTTELKSSV